MIDMICVGVDWGDLVEGVSEFVASRLTGTIRAMRVLRIMRLVRIVKLSSVSGTWLEQAVRSEKVMLVATMTKLTLFIVMLMHFIACIWYGIGMVASTDESGGWVDFQMSQYTLDENLL